MSFSKQQLQKFANLVKIEMSDEELAEMNLDVVFDWTARLQKIDTSGIEPMINPAHEFNKNNALRSDIISDGNIRDLILKNAPDTTGTSRGYFAVPKVMDE
jgi:aspartyl-tRNA(Asn)/glutamyl-tRNA(Gln) amidotransferase subunit C